MTSARQTVKAGQLVAGDTVLDWRGTYFRRRLVASIEIEPGRPGGRRGAYAECVVWLRYDDGGVQGIAGDHPVTIESRAADRDGGPTTGSAARRRLGP